MSLEINGSSIIALLALLVKSFNCEKFIDSLNVENEIKKKLTIIFAIVKAKVNKCEILDIEKIIPDDEFMVCYIFPIIAFSLDNYINDILVSLMDHAEADGKSGDYVKFCNRSKSIVDDFKKIKRFVDEN